MPINVSKNGGIIFSEEQIVSLYNAPITEDDQNLYFFKNGKKTFQITPHPASTNYRCLHYSLFSSVLLINHKNNLVVFNDNGSYKLLYEATNVATHKSQDNYLITFWSVLKTGATLQQQAQTQDYDSSVLGKSFKKDGKQYVYVYDSEKILKLKQNQLQDFQLDEQYNNIFCVAQIQMQEYIVSATQSPNDGTAQKVMVINRKPIVIDQKTDLYPVFDFTAGSVGGGGGIGQHQHIPYVDGTGYAFAVFHPGTSMPQLSWLNK